ncbi:MAG: indole-3-glycerol phosphate synthase TrpC [Proteobacteria bacterium]|nr:indole-3-glycerol phosphate synthase TrpC [Pseudomonadota bacterium]
MNSILEKINAHKKDEVAIAKKNKPLQSLDLTSSPIRDFVGSLSQKKPAIIAEIKKASPSKGLIRADFNVIEIAKTYEKNGASCLSVLTDIEFFKGHPDYLLQAKKEVSIPVLRKDFIIDSYQIYESRALGADCILLIVALLDDKALMDYCKLAKELGMAVLVESHTEEEFYRAIKLPTPLMGVNNRSLHSFDTDINISLKLKSHLPTDKLLITESGIHSTDDIKMMMEHNINSFLIGESLMRANDIGKKLSEFMNIK